MKIKVRIAYLICTIFLASFTTLQAQRVEQADKAFLWFVNDQTDSLYAAMTPDMQAAMQPNQLCGLFSQLEAQAGALQHYDNWKVLKVKGSAIYERVMHFQHIPLQLRLTLLYDGRIAGLFITQAPAAAAQSSAMADSLSEEIIIGYSQYKLPGTFKKPRLLKEKYPVVVLLAGSGPQDRNETVGPNHLLSDLADSLSAIGYASLRFDKGTKVYGNALVQDNKGFTYEDEVVSEAIRAVKYLHSRADVDATQIYLLGHSLSAMLLPLIAKESSHALAGYIALAAPARSMQTLIKEQTDYFVQQNIMTKEQAQATAKQLLAAMPEAYRNYDSAYNPVALHAVQNLPMLYLQGDADYQVTAEDLNMYRAQPSKQASYVLLPHVNHLMGTCQQGAVALPQDYMQRQEIAPSVMQHIRAFLKK